MGLGINRVAGLPELLQGMNPSCSAHQRKLFAASPVSWSVDAALKRRRIALRVAGRSQPISAENTSVDRTNEIWQAAAAFE
jgi:hypothetical protein